MRPPVQRCFPPFLALLPTLYLLEQHAETPLVHVLLRVAENISRGEEGRNRRVSVGRRGRARGVRTRGDDARGVSRTMIFVSRPASRLSLAIFASSTSGLVPLITSDPRPMGMANMVVKVNAPIARGFPRVPRTIQRHVGLFSHIQDMSPRPRTASIHNPIPVRGTQCAAKRHVGTLKIISFHIEAICKVFGGGHQAPTEHHPRPTLHARVRATREIPRKRRLY